MGDILPFQSRTTFNGSLVDLAESFVETLASLGRKGGLAPFASLFRKLGAELPQRFEMFAISLAPNADAKMKADQHARAPR
jgi:hypothetical protein